MSKKACSSSCLYIIVYMLSMIGLFLQMDLLVLYSMGLFRGQCLKCVKHWHPLYNNSQLMLLCENRGGLCTRQWSLAFPCLFSQFLSPLKKRSVTPHHCHSTFPTKLWMLVFKHSLIQQSFAINWYTFCVSLTKQ